MSDPLWKQVEDAAKQGAAKVTDAADSVKDHIVEGATRVEAGADSFLMKIIKSKWTWAILLGASAAVLFFVFN